MANPKESTDARGIGLFVMGGTADPAILQYDYNIGGGIAWTGPLISGWLIANFGGFSTAAMAIACVYALSLAAFFLIVGESIVVILGTALEV